MAASVPFWSSKSPNAKPERERECEEVKQCHLLTFDWRPLQQNLHFVYSMACMKCHLTRHKRYNSAEIFQFFVSFNLLKV